MSGGSYSDLTPPASGNVITRQWGLDVRDSVVTVHASLTALNATIPAPAEGRIAYLSDCDALYYGTNASAWAFFAAPPLWARRTSDGAAVNNSTALVSDAVITVPVAASATYKFDLHWVGDAHGSADIKMAWAIPAGAAGTWAPWGPAAAISSYEASTGWQSTGDLTTTQTFGAIGVGVLQAVRVSGCIVTAGTAGSLTLQVAQASAHASDLKTRTGTHLIAIRVA